jgi:hypothetical protein
MDRGLDGRRFALSLAASCVTRVILPVDGGRLRSL